MGAFGRSDGQKKQHKERAQPFNRERYGLLEKKKDYVLRADDYKQKQARLKTLRSKASQKNEDEFYFGMVHGRTRRGVAVKERGNQALTMDAVKILKTQDAAYIKTATAIERRKIEQLEAAQHMQEDTQGTAGSEDEAPKKRKISRSLFMEADEDIRDIVPKSSQSKKLEGDVQDSEWLTKIAKAKVRAKLELASRQDRLAKLQTLEKETALHRNLQTKGARKKVGTDKDGVAKYKWKQERKR
ncbi:small-subunit processome [Protomyces lactucae-debilis]|uniref:U3 small nucleolar RNA-associated protein 11 n=1 Tax=Protomyces lactucae-debilis TaxID=2754530 RepID=A0A1Y2FSP3_PROLT|nr:small-subunit processome [Protomyces lactucae-debilis]ORY87022.1 small-subunit processome [Protomyces lactucae-debilis]